MKPQYAILYHPRTLHEKNYRYFYLPYSLISIASRLEHELPCLLFDNNVHRCDYPSALPLPDPTEWALVGISAMIGHQITDGIQFAKYVRERSNCPILWGGACPTMLPSLVLNETASDYVVVGPGEGTVVDLWKALNSGDKIESIPGLQFRKSGEIVSTGTRAMTSYDDLPPYRGLYEGVGVNNYVRDDVHIASRTVSYHSSQGCAFRCAFCCEPVLWNFRWTAMSADRIISDILPLIEKYGVNGVKFYDSEFFIRPARAIEFARQIVRNGIDIRWAASIHPKNFAKLTADDVELLRKSGLSRLLMGAETAVKEELDLIGKSIDQDLVLDCSTRCAEADIVASFTFVTGYPGFPEDNIDKTLDFAERLVSISPAHEAKVHFFGPYPNTPLYPLAIEHGFQPPQTLEQWANYDYYYIQTPWISQRYFQAVRDFNERNYPNLIADDML